MKREYIRTGLFALSVCVLAFALGEIGIRTLRLDPASLIELDPCVGYKPPVLSHGTIAGPDGRIPVVTNSAGFRDVEHSLSKPIGIYRVLVLGDSYTEAVQVPMQDAFWRLIQTKADAANLPLEVITMGVSSWSTGQELLAYECYGRRYTPDFVILNFNEFDLGDNAFRQDPFTPTFSLVGGALILDESYKDRINDRLAARSTLYPGALYFLKDNSELIRYLLFVRANANAGKVLTDAEAVPINTDAAWDLTEALLARLATDTRADKTDLLVTYLPTLSYDPNASAILATHAREHNFEFLDLTPALQVAKATEPVQWPNDPHLTTFGHRIVADVLFDTISSYLPPAR